MLSSISPLGERARHHRWGVTAAWYVAGSVVAASFLGAVLGAVGGLLPLNASSRAALLAVVAVVALATELGRLPLPTNRRQVNEDWLNRYRGWVYGAGFGAQLGLGVATIVTSASIYLALAGEFLVGSMGAGALVGAAFGASRAAPIVAMTGRSTYGAVAVFHRWLASLAVAARRATLAVTFIAAVVFGTLSFGRIV